jgi:hypothetical protein
MILRRLCPAVLRTVQSGQVRVSVPPAAQLAIVRHSSIWNAFQAKMADRTEAKEGGWSSWKLDDTNYIPWLAVWLGLPSP